MSKDKECQPSSIVDSKITIEYLFKFGNFIFPTSFIKLDTYKVKPNQRQDMDAYTDASGVTHRNGLSHYKTEVTFTTRKLKSSEYVWLMRRLTQEYENRNERDAQCSFFDMEFVTDATVTRHMYMDPSIQIPLGGLIPDNTASTSFTGGELRTVDEIDWTFIEY